MVTFEAAQDKKRRKKSSQSRALAELADTLAPGKRDNAPQTAPSVVGLSGDDEVGRGGGSWGLGEEGEEGRRARKAGGGRGRGGAGGEGGTGAHLCCRRT